VGYLSKDAIQDAFRAGYPICGPKSCHTETFRHSFMSAPMGVADAGHNYPSGATGWGASWWTGKQSFETEFTQQAWTDVGTHPAVHFSTYYEGKELLRLDADGTLSEPRKNVTLAVVQGGKTELIGGQRLQTGECRSGTAVVSSVTSSMGLIATPVEYPGDGVYIVAYKSGPDTVTVKECALMPVTPIPTTFTVKAIQ
jgi:hypothetical protein